MKKTAISIIALVLAALLLVPLLISVLIAVSILSYSVERSKNPFVWASLLKITTPTLTFAFVS